MPTRPDAVDGRPEGHRRTCTNVHQLMEDGPDKAPRLAYDRGRSPIRLERLRRGRIIMRWVRYTADGKTAYGIVEGDRVIEVAGDPFAGYEKTARTRPLGSVKIEVPVIPRTFYCAGLNYTAHLKVANASIPEK